MLSVHYHSSEVNTSNLLNFFPPSFLDIFVLQFIIRNTKLSPLSFLRFSMVVNYHSTGINKCKPWDVNLLVYGIDPIFMTKIQPFWFSLKFQTWSALFPNSNVSFMTNHIHMPFPPFSAIFFEFKIQENYWSMKNSHLKANKLQHKNNCLNFKAENSIFPKIRCSTIRLISLSVSNTIRYKEIRALNQSR